MSIEGIILVLTEQGKFVNPTVSKEIIKLSESPIISEFITKNKEFVDSIKISKVRDFLREVSNNLINKKINIDIVKNVYNPYSVIFAICIHQESIVGVKKIFNTFNGMFIDIITDTKKFDIYQKRIVNLKKISSENYLIEFYWLIPLFLNINVFSDKSFNYNKFIEENYQTSVVVPEFVEGYYYYVINFSKINKDEYKQFLYDGTSKRINSTNKE